jgi:hypothetical protein
MTEHEASRTLVKSPPELWAECSDASSLARHLGSFGEIKITRLEPETAVAWEGERVSGTVRLEPSGWGTRVVLSARGVGADAGSAASEAAVGGAPEGAVEGPPPQPDRAPEPDPPREPPPLPPAPSRRMRPTVMARLRAWLSGERPVSEAIVPGVPEAMVSGVPEAMAPAVPEADAVVAAVSETDAVVAMAPETPAVEEAIDAEAILAAALESLGQAHHRPYSRP